jgi:hypothetical protein
MKLNPVGSTVLGTQMLTNSAIQLPTTHKKNSGKSSNSKKKSKKKAKDKYDCRMRSRSAGPALDGLLYFPQIKVLIRPTFKYFDTLSTASSQGGLQHMVITPLNAFYLEENNFYPSGNKDQIKLLKNNSPLERM